MVVTPPLLASPEQLTCARAVGATAAEHGLLTPDERAALDERLFVDGAPLAYVRQVVGELHVRAPRGSALERAALFFLGSTPPTRGVGILHAAATLIAVDARHGAAPLATAVRLADARGGVAEAVKARLITPCERDMFTEWLKPNHVEASVVSLVEKQIRARAEQAGVIPW